MGALKLERRLAEEQEASALGLPSGAHVVHLARVILAEGRPVSYLIDILPDDILDLTELSEEFTGSMLDLLMRRGSPSLLTSRCEINAVTATPEVSRALGIQRGDVLLRFIAFLYATDGRVVDYSYSYFLPGYFRFHVVRRVG
jgi:GntR family transcriptional regulator